MAVFGIKDWSLPKSKTHWGVPLRQAVAKIKYKVSLKKLSKDKQSNLYCLEVSDNENITYAIDNY